MGWNSSTKRMTQPVQIADIKDAIGTNSLDLGTLITTPNQNIAPWAKWKPVRSSELSLDTVESRKTAGRTDALTDYTRQYGLHATGVSNSLNLSDIHTCRFEYEQPIANSGYKYRVLDMVHPVYGETYGYRSDAQPDLYGAVPPTSGNNIVLPYDEIGLPIDITYSPHSGADANEMISIQDFLTNEAGQGTTYDPLNCYPCVLITQGSYHYIRGLYKLGASSISTIGVTGHETWYLDMRNAPTGSEAWDTGQSATLSVFLCSSATIHTTVPVQNISNWVVIPVSQSGTSLWDAWFCPVPDATGKTVYFSPPAQTTITINNAQYSQDKTQLVVNYTLSSTIASSTHVIRVEMGGDTAEFGILIQAGSSRTADATFTLSTAFPSTVFTPGISTTNTYVVSAVNKGVTPEDVLDSETYTLTYS